MGAEDTATEKYVIEAVDYLSKVIDWLLGERGNQLSFTQSYLGKLFTVRTEAVVLDDFGVAKVDPEAEPHPDGRTFDDRLKIPKGSQIAITDHWIDQGKLVFVFAQNYGWISPAHLQGKFINETLESRNPVWQSQDPAHKVVGRADAYLRDGSSKLYPERKPRIKILKGNDVRIQKQSADGKYVLVTHDDGAQWGWISMSYLAPAADPAQPDRRKVMSEQAYLRDEIIDYPLRSSKPRIAQGKRVVVKAASQDTNPPGTFVLVSDTIQEGDTWLEGAELGWTSSSNLVDGWGDFKGPNAAWDKGAYIGQKTIVEIVGTASIEVYSEEKLLFYLVLADEARKENIFLSINEGFRSYAKQEALRKELGSQAAKPGLSNHQDGFAVDINTNGYNSDVYRWLKEHAPSIGFIRTVTNEPWHWEHRPSEAKKYGFKMPYVRHKKPEDTEPLNP